VLGKYSLNLKAPILQKSMMSNEIYHFKMFLTIDKGMIMSRMLLEGQCSGPVPCANDGATAFG